MIAAALFSITSIVTPMFNLDPINVPKFLTLTVFGFGLLALLLVSFKKWWPQFEFKPAIVLALLVPISMTLSLVFSKSPLEQQLFGTYGRNTGLITYLSFSILFIAATLLNFSESKRKISISILAVVILNVLYGYIQLIGLDPIKWSSLYAPIFGTFGNPDFMSGFLGMSFGLLLTQILLRPSNFKINSSLICLSLLVAFLTYKTKSTQGLVLIVELGAISLYFFLVKLKIHKRLIATYVISVVSIALLSILGMLHIGPFSTFLYKSSVTQRGDYWDAAIEMIKNKPFFGIGLDSFGDYYRSARSPQAAERFNSSVVTNSAHNVFLDIGSTAGLITLLAYLAIIFYVMFKFLKKIKREGLADVFALSIFVMWIGYLSQSTISINNIALGVWGWILPGLLLSFCRDSSQNNANKNTPKKQDFINFALIPGLVIGFLIGYLPFRADSNLRFAIEKSDLNLIIKSTSIWPHDTQRYNYVSAILENNRLTNESISVGRNAISYNPQSFESWQFMLKANASTNYEKDEALKKLKLLDPFNVALKNSH